MADTVETAIYKLRVEGEEDILALTRSINELGEAEEKATASTRKTEEALQKQIARYDPIIRAQEQYKKALQDVASYRESGIGSETQLSALQEAAVRRYQAATKAVNDFGKATESHTNASKLQRYEMINLNRQLQDVVVSLWSGQKAMTVFVQQGAQIGDIATSSGVSLKNMFLQAAEQATSFLTPVRAAIGVVAALAASVGYLTSQWGAAQREARLATAGIGGASGTSVGDINRFAQRESSYGGLSTGEARAAAIELTKTGQIAINTLHGVGDAIHGFAILMNTDAAAATKTLAQALSGDLVKGMDDLNKVTGDFSAKDREFIQSLQAGGKEAEARQFMIDKMSNSTRKAAAETGFWSDQWDRFKQAVSSAAENLGKALSGGDLEERLARTKAALDELEKSGRTDVFANEIDNLRKKVAELNAELEKNAADSAGKKLKILGTEAQVVTEKLIPQIAQLRQAQNEYAKLREAQEAGLGSPIIDAAIRKLATYIAQLEYAIAHLNTIASIDPNEKFRGISPAGLEQTTNTLGTITEQNKQWIGQSKEIVNLTGDTGKALAQVGVNGKVIYDNSNKTADATERTADAAEAHNRAQYQANLKVHEAAVEADKLATQMWRANLAAETFGRNMSGVSNWIADQEYIATSFASRAAGQPGSFVGSAGSPSGSGILVGGFNNPFYAYQQAQQISQTAPSFAQQVAAAGAGGVQAALNFAMGQQARGPTLYGTGMDVYGGAPGQPVETQKAIAEEDIVSQVTSLYQTLNQMNPAAQAANMQAEMAWLQSRPTSVAQQQAIAQLQQSIQGLTKSTDQLNATNQELLSPYYTQDPRTSHIGFRSQGMATGGWVDVPGGYSANDNLIATIPVASGERIFVDPMGSRRTATGPGHTTINISQPIMIAGNADKDQLGRTLFQSNQGLAKRINAATAR